MWLGWKESTEKNFVIKGKENEMSYCIILSLVVMHVLPIKYVCEVGDVASLGQ